jgi:hypothetical protein
VPGNGLPAESLYEVRRAALWLASCRDRADARATAAQRQACQEHPAVWQACMQRGLCDIRDLNDLLLRTLPADQWQAAERLAQVLAPKLGR